MDFELLEEIIEDLENDESAMMKKYLLGGMTLRQIAADEGLSYDAMKKKHLRIRAEIKEEVMECFGMSHDFTDIHVKKKGGENYESNQ
jgi:DNA-directed RNA polymerase specialized sigma24 family protein